MAIFNESISAAKAINMIVKEVIQVIINNMPRINKLIESYGFTPKDEKEVSIYVVSGFLAINMAKLFESKGDAYSQMVNKDMEYFYDYQIEERKVWQKVSKIIYDFYMYNFLNKRVKTNKCGIGFFTPIGLMATLLLAQIISGELYPEMNKILPQKDPRTIELLNGFYPLIYDNTNTIYIIDSKYNVKWQ